MKNFLPNIQADKLLPDSAHDAMPYYMYCNKAHILPFIVLDDKGDRPLVYKNDLTIDKDGVPICCKAVFRMRRDGTEIMKGRTKFKCPKIRPKLVLLLTLVLLLAPKQSTEGLSIQ